MNKGRYPMLMPILPPLSFLLSMNNKIPKQGFPCFDFYPITKKKSDGPFFGTNRAYVCPKHSKK